MSNTLWNLIWTEWKTLAEIREEINPRLPNDVVTYKDNTWKKSNKIDDLYDEINKWNFVFYIWAFYKDKEWNIDEKSTYNLTLIEWICDHILKDLPKWKKVKIKIASPVWFACWNFNQENEVLNPEIQEKLIEATLQKKLWINRKDKVELIQISQWHEELIETIESICENEEDIENKLWKWEINLWENWLSSLEIAKVLYRALKESKQFYWDIISTMTTKSKNRYYSIYELAIRLADFLRWEDIQWTTESSKEVNNIFYNIVNWEKYVSKNLIELYNYILRCKRFHRRSNEYWNNKPIWVCIDKKSLKKEINLKNRKKNRIKRLLQWTALSISLILWSWWIWIWIDDYFDHIEEQRLEEWSNKDEELFLESMYQTLGTELYIWSAWVRNIMHTSIEWLKSWYDSSINKAIEIFYQRYWFDIVDKNVLRRAMVRCSINIYGWDVDWFNKFLDYFNYKWEIPFFIERTLDFLPESIKINTYWRLWGYRKESLETLKYEENKEISQYNIKELWKYTTREWIEYDIGIVWCLSQIPLPKNYCWYNGLLVAKKSNYWNDLYSIDTWKIVALDIFWNTYLNRLANKINNVFITVFLDWTYINIRNLIIEDLVLKIWLIDTKTFINWSNKEIIEYLSWFLERYKNKMPQKNKINDRPYKSFIQYKEIFIEALEMKQIRSAIYYDDISNEDKYIWSYYDENWDKYFIYIREEKWKNYILINKIGWNTYLKMDNSELEWEKSQFVIISSANIDYQKMKEIIETILWYLE